MTILPFALREPALERRRQRDFGKLWQPIAEFNAHMGIEGPGHLVFFLRRFRKQLDQFVAEFERVPRQVGALIRVGGKVVGIERTPSVSYWEAVWSCLIRECYGSFAIQMAKNGHASRPPATRLPLPETITSLDQLGSALTAIDTEEERRITAKVTDLGDKPFSTAHEEKVGGLLLETVDHRGFVGQVVRDDDRVVYASIIASTDGMKARPWHQKARRIN